MRGYGILFRTIPGFLVVSMIMLLVGLSAVSALSFDDTGHLLIVGTTDGIIHHKIPLNKVKRIRFQEHERLAGGIAPREPLFDALVIESRDAKDQLILLSSDLQIFFDVESQKSDSPSPKPVLVTPSAQKPVMGTTGISSETPFNEIKGTWNWATLSGGAWSNTFEITDVFADGRFRGRFPEVKGDYSGTITGRISNSRIEFTRAGLDRHGNQFEQIWTATLGVGENNRLCMKSGQWRMTRPQVVTGTFHAERTP